MSDDQVAPTKKPHGNTAFWSKSCNKKLGCNAVLAAASTTEECPMELLPDRVASMMSSIGSNQFGRELLGLFDPNMELTHCAAFERRGRGKAPRMIVSAAASVKGQSQCIELAKQWTERDYKEDPLLVELESHACSAPTVYYADIPAAPRCSGLRARMVEQYYDRLDIGEEATYTRLSGDNLIGVSLFKRRGSANFTTCQREALVRMTGLMISSVQRHGQLLPTGNEPSAAAAAPLEISTSTEWTQTRAEKLARLRSALLMDASHLTLREAEICASIVMGYTVFAISLLLGISPNTVATHRKRAYSKLGLSSQTELFNVCLKYVV